MMREEIFTLKLPAAKAPEFLHGITPNDFLTVAGDVETLSGSFHRGLTQRDPFLSSVPRSSGQEAGSA
jgi:hypothetical protein